MKKLIIISYLFPPFNQIGAKRAYYFSQYLSKMGFDVTVISSELPDKYSVWEVPLNKVKVIRVPIRNKNRIKGIENKATRFINALISPLDAHARLDYNDIDLTCISTPDYIIATGGPWHIFELGVQLKEQFKQAKLVLDYRDAWGIYDDSVKLDSLSNFGKGIGKLKEYKYKWKESQLLRKADGIIAATPPLKENVIQNPAHQFKTDFQSATIYNGFEKASTSVATKKSTKFSLVYTGILRKEQEHELFVKGFELFLRKEKVDQNLVEAVFVGSEHSRLQELLSTYRNSDFNNRIKITPFLDRKQARKYQEEATLLLNMSYSNTRGILSGKILEYLELEKTILIVSIIDDEMEKLIRNTNTGKVVSNAEEMSEVLAEWYDEWQKEGRIEFEPDREAMNFYSNEAQIEKLNQFLTDL